MAAKLIFLRRTLKEIEVFGGEVYIDIDGRNIGILSTSDFTYEINTGIHKIKMYKSHTYGSFIGIAEIEIAISEAENLLIKYSSPMLINQPGNIIISDFKSYSQAESMAIEKENKIINDDNEAKQRQYEQEEKTKNGIIIFVVIMIIGAIIWGIYYADLMSSF